MTPASTPDQTRLAVLAIVIAVASLSLGDAVIKAAGLSLPLWQMFILRSALAIPILWGLVRRRGGFGTRNLHWALLRSALLIVMWLSYYSALPLMPLSLAAAAYYTGPLFIVALSAVLARRWPTGRLMLAIAGGFVGVLLIIRPDASGLDLGTLLPLIAAFLYACAMVLTSAKCQEDDPFFLALVFHGAFAVSGAVLGLFAGREGSFIFGPWQTVDLRLLALIGCLAVLILIGSVGAAIAYQKGPPATVAAFDYSYLVFSLIWGGLVFAEWPGVVALLGIAVIVGSGLLAVTRVPERRGSAPRPQ